MWWLIAIALLGGLGIMWVLIGLGSLIAILLEPRAFVIIIGMIVGIVLIKTLFGGR